MFRTIRAVITYAKEGKRIVNETLDAFIKEAEMIEANKSPIDWTEEEKKIYIARLRLKKIRQTIADNN